MDRRRHDGTRFLARYYWLGLIVPLILMAAPAKAVTPSGSVDISVSGYDVTFALRDMKGVNQNYEVTVGTTCTDAAGTQLVMWDTSTNNAGHNPYILEIHWFGHYDRLATATMPLEAVACRSQLIAAKWFKGEATAAWVLDPWQDFSVPQ